MRFGKPFSGFLLVVTLVQQSYAGAIDTVVKRLESDNTNDTMVVVLGGWDRQRVLSAAEAPPMKKAVVNALRAGAAGNGKGANQKPNYIDPPPFGPSGCLYAFERSPLKAGAYSNEDRYVWCIYVYERSGVYVKSTLGSTDSIAEFVNTPKGADVLIGHFKQKSLQGTKSK